MKLYELRRRHLFILAGGDATVYWLNNLDGLSSFCRDSAGRNVHIKATAAITPVPVDTGYLVLLDGAAIWCLTCGRVSHSAGDVAGRYCGNCRMFHDD